MVVVPVKSASVITALLDAPQYLFAFGVKTTAWEVTVPAVKIPVLSFSPKLFCSTGAWPYAASTVYVILLVTLTTLSLPAPKVVAPLL